MMDDPTQHDLKERKNGCQMLEHYTAQVQNGGFSRQMENAARTMSWSLNFVLIYQIISVCLCLHKLCKVM